MGFVGARGSLWARSAVRYDVYVRAYVCTTKVMRMRINSGGNPNALGPSKRPPSGCDRVALSV